MALLAPGAEPIELRWRAPAECPGQAEVEGGVRELLGAAQPQERVVVDAALVRDGGGYTAELALSIGDATSERRLTARSCDALADAIALVIAVTIDPTQALGDVAAEETVAVPEPAATELDASVPPLPGDPAPLDATGAPAIDATAAPTEPSGGEASKRRRPGFHARVLGGLDVGSGPDPTGTLGGALGVRGRWYRAELEVAGAFATEATAIAGARARIARWSLAPRGCGVPGRGRFEIPLCAALELGALEGEGTGETVRPESTRRLWIAANVGVALAIALGRRIALVVGADMVAPLWRARFVIGRQQVFRPRPVGVRALAGIELRLGGRR